MNINFANLIFIVFISSPSAPSGNSFKASSYGGGLSSAYKFGVLTKIVKHLKNKFQEGEDSPLTLEEILDETNQLDVNAKTRQVYLWPKIIWLKLMSFILFYRKLS